MFFFLLVCAIRDSKVITCSASSVIKRQVHSNLINAEACTPAISSHERWNVLTETLQNKHHCSQGLHNAELHSMSVDTKVTKMHTQAYTLTGLKSQLFSHFYPIKLLFSIQLHSTNCIRGTLYYSTTFQRKSIVPFISLQPCFVVTLQIKDFTDKTM